MDYAIFWENIVKMYRNGGCKFITEIVPFAEQRNTNLNKRTEHLKKVINKKILFLIEKNFPLQPSMPQNFLTRWEHYILTNSAFYTNTSMAQMSVLLHSLEIINFTFKNLLKQQEYSITNKYLTNLYEPIQNNNKLTHPFKTLQIHPTRTKLYTSLLSYKSSISNYQNLLAPITLLMSINLNTIVYLIQYTNYAQQGQISWGRKANIPYEQNTKIPEIPLYIIEIPLQFKLIYNNLYSSEADKSNNGHNITIKALLPSYYYKPLKQFYISKTTVLAVAKFVKSKKRAKKYLRILHKRLRLYKKKKVAWR